MLKNKKAVVILCVTINLVIVLIMIGVMYMYASQNITALQAKNSLSAENANRSISDNLKLYFDRQQRSMLNRKNYIMESGMSCSEATDYLSKTGRNNTNAYQLVSCSTYQAVSCSPDGTIEHKKYSSSYTGNIYVICDRVKSDTVDDTVFNATEAFTNPFNGMRSIALYTGLTLRGENGNDEAYLMLATDKLNDLVGTNIPQPPFTDSNSAMVDSDGDYITKTREFKNENIFELFRIYNNMNYREMEELHERVMNQEKGSLSYKNYDGTDCLYSFCKIEGTNDWYCFTCIPKSSFEESNIDYLFALILSAFLLVLALFDGSIILVLNHKLKRSFASESKMRQSAESANLAKSEFLSRMSHEIRTPLNAVIGYNSLAQDALRDIEKNPNTLQNALRATSCLTKSEVASRHLLSVINDVLDMSSIESGKIRYTPELFNFKELISSLSTMFHSLAGEKGVTFQAIFENELDEVIIGDQMRIKQILTNLVGNAIKFTPENGLVTMTMSQNNTENRNEAEVTFIIQDNGIGMDKEFLDRIWSPFEQADASISRRFGGSGLGLSISKKLVELAGGSISVESAKGSGSTFNVKIPVKRVDASTREDKVSSSLSFNNLRVLVIDNEEKTCEYLSLLLNRFSVKNTCVNSGVAALEILNNEHEKENDFNLCLLDWKMPDMNGMETAKAIRERFGNDVPVVIITSYDYSSIADEAASIGVNKFIAKPIFQSTLFNMLANLTGIGTHGEMRREKLYNFSSARVLLAEDNDMNIEIAKAILNKVGITVDVAENGQECLDIFLCAPAGTYGAILMDVQMPVMDGYEATQKIRSSDHPDAQTIPIIAMTADAFEENVKMALDVGMNDHIAKPIDIDLLFASLDRFINKSS